MNSFVLIEKILFYSYILLFTPLMLYSEVIIPFCAMFKVLFSFRNFVSEIIRKLSMEGFSGVFTCLWTVETFAGIFQNLEWSLLQYTKIAICFQKGLTDL